MSETTSPDWYWNTIWQQLEEEESDKMQEKEDEFYEFVTLLAILLLTGTQGPSRGRKPPRLPWEQRLCFLDLMTR